MSDSQSHWDRPGYHQILHDHGHSISPHNFLEQDDAYWEERRVISESNLSDFNLFGREKPKNKNHERRLINKIIDAPPAKLRDGEERVFELPKRLARKYWKSVYQFQFKIRGLFVNVKQELSFEECLQNNLITFQGRKAFIHIPKHDHDSGGVSIDEQNDLNKIPIESIPLPDFTTERYTVDDLVQRDLPDSYGADVDAQTALTPEQEEEYQWSKIIEDFRKAHEGYKNVNDNDLQQWAREQISRGYVVNDPIPIITEISTDWGKEKFRGTDVDTMYITAYSHAEARSYIKKIGYDGFWMWIGPIEGTKGDIHMTDSLIKFHEIEFEWTEQLVEELHQVVGDESLRDQCLQDGLFTYNFVNLVKRVQDKLFEEQPHHYGMYTEETREKVLQYIKNKQELEDFETNTSFEQEGMGNMTPMMEERFNTSQQLNFFNMTGTLELFRNYQAFETTIHVKKHSLKQRKKLINECLRIRNKKPEYTLADWENILNQKLPNNRGSIYPQRDKNKWPKENYVEFEAYNTLNGHVLNLGYAINYSKQYMRLIFHLENSRWNPSQEPFKDWDDFAEAYNAYDADLDAGRNMRQNIYSKEPLYDFKGMYEKYLWDRTFEEITAGEKKLYEEMKKYGTFSLTKGTTLGPEINQLCKDLLPLKPLFDEAYKLKQEAFTKETRRGGNYSIPTYTERGKRLKNKAESLESQGKKLFKPLRSKYPILLSTEFNEVLDISKLARAADKPSKVVSILWSIYKNRKSDLDEVKKKLREKPERIWDIVKMLGLTQAELGITSGSAQAHAINMWRAERTDDDSWVATLASIGLGILSVFFPILIIPALAAGIYDFSKSLDEYQYEDALSGGSYDPEEAFSDSPPSAIWLLIDAVAIIFDFAEALKPLKLAKLTTKASATAKLWKHGTLNITEESLTAYRKQLDLDLIKYYPDAAKRKELVDLLSDPERLRRIQKEADSRAKVLKNRSADEFSGAPDYLKKLFEDETLGDVYLAGAIRLGETPLTSSSKGGNLFDFMDHLDVNWFKKYPDWVQKMVRLAGESENFTKNLRRIDVALKNGKKSTEGGSQLDLITFLEHTLGSPHADPGQFFDNLKRFEVTDEQMQQALKKLDDVKTVDETARLFKIELDNLIYRNKSSMRKLLKEGVEVFDEVAQANKTKNVISENKVSDSYKQQTTTPTSTPPPIFDEHRITVEFDGEKYWKTTEWNGKINKVETNEAEFLKYKSQFLDEKSAKLLDAPDAALKFQKLLEAGAKIAEFAEYISALAWRYVKQFGLSTLKGYKYAIEVIHSIVTRVLNDLLKVPLFLADVLEVIWKALSGDDAVLELATVAARNGGNVPGYTAKVKDIVDRTLNMINMSAINERISGIRRVFGSSSTTSKAFEIFSASIEDLVKKYPNMQSRLRNLMGNMESWSPELIEEASALVNKVLGQNPRGLDEELLSEFIFSLYTKGNKVPTSDYLKHLDALYDMSEELVSNKALANLIKRSNNGYLDASDLEWLTTYLPKMKPKNQAMFNELLENPNFRFKNYKKDLDRLMENKSIDDAIKAIEDARNMRAQESAKLKRAMKKAGETVPANYQAHHIIPVELYNRYKEQLFKYFKKYDLFDLNDAKNGIALPPSKEVREAAQDVHLDFDDEYWERVFHYGSHPNYTDQIEEQILITLKNLDKPLSDMSKGEVKLVFENINEMIESAKHSLSSNIDLPINEVIIDF